jgi:glycosyltransferase involved in cell wall biosynthesis
MNILMISSTFPYPPTKGGTQGRTFNLLKNVIKHHAVTLITQGSADVTEAEIEELRQYVEELVIFPRPEPTEGGLLPKLQRLGQFLTTGTPPNVSFLYSGEIQAWIDQRVQEGKFQVITAEHSVNEVYIRPQWRQQIRTVIDIHSSLYRTCQNQLETKTSKNELRDRFYLPLLRRYEQQTLGKFSHIVVTTDEDAQQMRSFAPKGQISLIANAVDLNLFPYRTKDPGGHNLVFVGGLDYFANIDAACYLGGEILPRLEEKYPYVTLTLVGSNPAPEVRALAQNPKITVTGRVPAIVDYLHQATLAVIAMRTGFGMKFKTLEAMAAGVPVVASDRGLEGMKVDEPLSAWRANEMEEYIEAISRLFEDADLRATLSHNARQLIEQEYTWEKSSSQYERLLSGNLV